MHRSSMKKIGYAALGSLTDLLIWNVALVGASFGKTGPRGVYEAFRETDEVLKTVNHNTLVATWHQLTKKKLIKYQKRGNIYSPVVTKYGLSRLKEQIPIYHSARPWDKKIYLITYDIPETNSKKRYLLRAFLKRITAALLQESVWLTPYNPRELLNDFIEKKKIPGTIIVSDVGKDGGVGETSIQDLVVNVYKLEALTERYEEFIKKVRSKSFQSSYLLLEYLSILKDDPQLPFEILPKGWFGDKAYKISQQLLPKNSLLKTFQ